MSHLMRSFICSKRSVIHFVAARQREITASGDGGTFERQTCGTNKRVLAARKAENSPAPVTREFVNTSAADGMSLLLISHVTRPYQHIQIEAKLKSKPAHGLASNKIDPLC